VLGLLAEALSLQAPVWPYGGADLRCRRGGSGRPGDCGHGAACSLLDALQLEARGIPVAWLDTAGRVPRVRRRMGRFLIEYAANKRLEAHAAGRDLHGTALQERLLAGFERFGFHRALRVAGARPGAAVEVGSLKIELWDYPEVSYPKIPDGIPDYPYVEISPVARLSQADLEREALRVAPLIRTRLERSGRRSEAQASPAERERAPDGASRRR
jgi:hypothetical protein